MVPASTANINNTAANGKTPAVMTLGTFLQGTRPKSATIATGNVYVDNGTTSIQMPSVGLANVLWLKFNVSVVIGGTVTGGTFKGWPSPAPFSIAKRIRFGSNNNIYYRDYSGWEAYKHIRYRTGFDPLQGTTGTNFSSGTQATLGMTATNLIRPGTAVAVGTWVGSFTLPIPLAYNRQGQLGMLVFQQNQIFFNLAIDWGQWASAAQSAITNDLVTGVTGTAVTITPTVTLDVGYDYFDLLPGMAGSPLISYFMSVNQFTPGTAPAIGQNVVQIPQTDYVTMALLEVISNALPYQLTNFSNVIMSHSGNVYDHQDNYSMKQARSLMEHDGLIPMDGVLDWDMGIRMGVMDKRDTVDAFNDQNITNLQFQYALGGSLTNPTSVMTIEALRPLTA